MEIVGRLTADAKVKTLKNERRVVSFSVAVNDSYRQKGTELPVRLTSYFNCSYWLNPAIAKWLTKGALVELYGRIGVNAWTGAGGEANATLNFHVNSIKLHGKPNGAGNAASTSLSGTAIKNALADAVAIEEPAEDLPF